MRTSERIPCSSSPSSPRAIDECLCVLLLQSVFVSPSIDNESIHLLPNLKFLFLNVPVLYFWFMDGPMNIIYFHRFDARGHPLCSWTDLYRRGAYYIYYHHITGGPAILFKMSLTVPPPLFQICMMIRRFFPINRSQVATMLRVPWSHNHENLNGPLKHHVLESPGLDVCSATSFGRGCCLTLIRLFCSLDTIRASKPRECRSAERLTFSDLFLEILRFCLV